MFYNFGWKTYPVVILISLLQFNFIFFYSGETNRSSWLITFMVLAQYVVFGELIPFKIPPKSSNFCRTLSHLKKVERDAENVIELMPSRFKLGAEQP